MRTDDTLHTDLEWFRENRKKLFAEHGGMWLAIKSGKVIAVAGTFPEAFRRGAEKAKSPRIAVVHAVMEDEVDMLASYSFGLIGAEI